LRNATLIYNPVAGRGRTASLAHRICQTLEAEGWRVEPLESRQPGETERLARAAARAAVDAVFALGGDGTLRECAAGVLGSESAVAFLPGGTTNVMALPLGLPQDPHQACRLLANGRPGELDVGLCGQTPFLMQASVGLDAAAIAALQPTTKRFLGKGAIVPAALKAWLAYGYPSFEISIDKESYTATFAAVCNIPFYGGKWRMAPAARPTDGRLHLVLFGGRGRSRTLSFAFDMLRDRHLERGDVKILTVETVILPEVPGLTLQLDGDSFPDRLPARVQLSPHRLRVLLPPNL
jgi:YegS/Rv2252/BmrU family lipid kinase